MSSLNQADLGEIVSGLAEVLPAQPRIYDAALVFWDYLIEHGLDEEIIPIEAKRCDISLYMAGYALGLAALAKEPVVVEVDATGKDLVLRGDTPFRPEPWGPDHLRLSDTEPGYDGMCFTYGNWLAVTVVSHIFDLELWDIPDARQFGPRYFR